MSAATYLTVAEAALWTGRSERTIRRWMTGRLLTIFRRGDGILVLELAELTRVEREQRASNPASARSRARAQKFAQVRTMSYPRQ